ncbi:MAG: ribosomal RNA small subunit methyltransferase A [Ignavibacteriae bacterium]|nr:ribosomal RNA small subunit methyltransferase A [Ignavibacteriota bacterium]
MNKSSEELLSNKEKYKKYRPKKFLGQNFLVDNNIARKIISSLDIAEGDNVLEIGPGHGALTKFLVEKDCNYSAVELDKSIYENLQQEYGDKINLVHKDFLKLTGQEIRSLFNNKSKIKIIGNIPYNITSEILFRIFDMRDDISIAIMMMQKEVAHRLTAKPNTKDYGILAVQTGLYSDVKILFNVPPTAFFPKPRVHSSVVKFRLKDIKIKNEDLFKTVVRTSFGQRRKVMSNSLKQFFEESGIDINSINFDFSRRPESLTIDEFLHLTNLISKKRVK